MGLSTLNSTELIKLKFIYFDILFIDKHKYIQFYLQKLFGKFKA